MSLINDMLKDLEKRRAKDRFSTRNESIEGLSSVDRNRNQRLLLRRIFVFVLLFIIIASFFWVILHKKKIPPLPKRAITPVEEVSKKEEVESVVTPVKTTQDVIVTQGKPAPEIIIADSSATASSVDSITVTQDNEQILVQLNLTRSVHYQLHVSPDHQLLTLMLSNTDLKEQLSDIQNAIIKSIQFRKGLNNDLFLMFSVLPGTEVKSLVMSEKEPFQLVMTLVNKDIAYDQFVEKTEVPLTPAQAAESTYMEALKLIDKNDLTAARRKLRDSLLKAPDFIPARKTLATLLISQRYYHQAEVLLQEGLTHTPHSVELIKLYARVLVAENRLQKALHVLQQLSPKLDEDPGYYAFIAALQQRLGHPLIAAELYSQLLRLESNGIWWMGLGIALESVGKQNAALNAYNHAAISGDLEPSVEAYVKTKIAQIGD